MYRSLEDAKREAARRELATGIPHKIVISLPGKKAPRYSVVRNPFAVNVV